MTGSTSGECWVEITTEVTFGFPFSYIMVTWLFESGSNLSAIPFFLSDSH